MHSIVKIEGQVSTSDTLRWQLFASKCRGVKSVKNILNTKLLGSAFNDGALLNIWNIK